MSITGSLVGYENNNDIANNTTTTTTSSSSSSSYSNSSSNNKQKRRSILLNSNSGNHVAGKRLPHSSMGKHCPPSLNSSISNSVSGHHHHQQHHYQQSAPPLQQQQQHFPQQYMNSKRKHANNYHNMLMHPGAHLDHSNYLHLNSLWSIWYGVLLTLFQGYLAVHGAYRFLGCSLIPWKIEPVAELNLQIVLSGVVFILLPLFFTSAVFKVGNLANDGIKLATGAKERRCSMSPHDGLEEEARGGTLRALWTHGGPTAAFVHIVIAMCLLLPRLLLEARIIENGLLPRENIWQTELDFVAISRRNLVVLSVVSSPYQNLTNFEEDEEYYNDTMFTATGGGSSNNLLDFSSGEEGKTVVVSGKTRHFEVPDLFNRESNENVDNNNSNKNNNDYNASVGGGRERSRGGGGGGRQEEEGEGEQGLEERISVEQFDSEEFVPIKPYNTQITTTRTTAPATSSTTSSTTTTTTTTTTTSTTTTAMPTTKLINHNNRIGMEHKKYDKSWDRLGTLGKDNSRLNNKEEDGEEDEEEEGVGEDVVLITTISSNILRAAPTIDNFSSESSSTSTVKTTPKATATATQKAATKTYPNKQATKTATVATTTTNVADIASSTVIPITTRTQPTRTHHHKHQHQHQQQQQKRKHNHHHNGNNNNNSSSGSNNRQHHRQRSHQTHHRRHHNNNNNNSNTSSAGGRSAETRTSRADLRPSKAADFNRLDDELTLTTAHSKTSHFSAVPSVDDTPPAKTTAIISTTTRDSNIHIVKPEKLPEIIPSTPLTSNSKIIEIKTKSKKRAKRMADEELQVEIEPEYLIGDLPANDSSEYLNGNAISAERNASSENTPQPPSAVQPGGGLVRLDGFAGMLQIFFGIEKPIDVTVFDRPPSAEFINLLFALLVWCVRYPAVFWTTTKSFATVFSIQMIAAALDIVFSYIGAANLYKLQVYAEAMPIQNPGLILNGVVTLALFLLSSVLMVASSMIMYLYGHGRLAAKMRDRSLITLKSSESWIYFAHCASLCYVLALAVVKAPLLNDLSSTYRSNLHCPTFLSALISVVHLLLWIVIWLGLTAKRRWTFKLPPMDTYGLSKATTQPLLMANRGSLPSAGSGSGSGSGSVLATEQKTGMGVMGAMPGSGNGGGHISTASSVDGGGGVDDVYWPKLTPSSPKLKVTFNEVTSTCDDDELLIGDDHEQNDGKRHSTRGATVCFASATGEIDDGEYATLRAATAATVVGINLGSMSVGGSSGGGGNSMSGANGTTPTGSLSMMSVGGSSSCVGVRILHLSEYDELLPPPPAQLISTDCGGSPLGTGSSIHQSQLTLVGDYANCGGSILGLGPGGGDDNTSEEGKLLACVRDDSVTYASTRDLEPPQASSAQAAPPPPPPPPLQQQQQATSMNVGRAPQAMPENMQLSSSPEHLVSPLAPVTVTVHTNEAHIASSSTPRCLRRADSGVPNEALTPRSDTTSTTESTTSPPERAPSESSSGVHSGEERDVEVVIRPRAACKPPPKPSQPPIQEEPYGRCTNMRMSSFAAEPARNSNSATLPLTRSTPEQKFDYANHCSTMPLPVAHNQQQQQQQQLLNAHRGSGNYATTSVNSMHSQQHQQLPSVSSFRAQYANSAVAMAGANAARMQQQQLQQQQLQQLAQQASSQPLASNGTHTTLPNGVRYSNPHFLRRLPHVTKAAESPYGHLGLGAGHHTFSKLLQDPLQHSLVNTTIPEDRDSANYSMSSDHDCHLYSTAQQLN